MATAAILTRWPPLSAGRDTPAYGDSRRLARDRIDQHDRLQAEFRYGDIPVAADDGSELVIRAAIDSAAGPHCICS